MLLSLRRSCSSFWGWGFNVFANCLNLTFTVLCLAWAGSCAETAVGFVLSRGHAHCSLFVKHTWEEGLGFKTFFYVESAVNPIIFSSGMWDLISLKSMAAPMDPFSVQLLDPGVCERRPVSSCYCSETISGFCWSQDKDTILPRAHRVVLKHPPPPSPQIHTGLPFASEFCILPSTTGPLHMQLSLLVEVHWGI